MNFKINIFIIAFALTTSCKTQLKSDYRKILLTSCLLESYIALSEDSFTIYQNILNKEDGEFYNQVYYTKYLWSKDSLQRRLNKDLYAPAKLDSLDLMRKSDYFIDLTKYIFKYDIPPVTTNNQINESEKKLKYKFLLGSSVFLIENNSSQKKLIVQRRNEKDIIINLSKNPLESDFILYDINKDGNPEIFVFTKSYISGRNIVDVVIYKIEV